MPFSRLNRLGREKKKRLGDSNQSSRVAQRAVNQGNKPPNRENLRSAKNRPNRLKRRTIGKQTPTRIVLDA